MAHLVMTYSMLLSLSTSTPLGIPFGIDSYRSPKNPCTPLIVSVIGLYNQCLPFLEAIFVSS